jgi:bacterioferritin-associated ferredoxin
VRALRTVRAMIICSCTAITDRDIEAALLEILNRPDAPIPTPGVVYRHLQKRMNCCGCAPLAVETIYNKVDELERKGLISPNVCETARSRLLEISAWRPRLRRKKKDAAAAPSEKDDTSLKVA